MAFRRTAFAIWLYGWTVLMVIGLIPTLVMPRGAVMAGVRLWSRLATWGLRWIGGVGTEIRGLDRLPAGGVLVAAKHQSMFDIMPPFSFMPDAAFVLKKELARIPLFGWHCRKAKMIVVDREGHAKALRELVAAAVDRLNSGRQVIIFPEGTRKPPGAPPDYKPGVAALYRELGVPCVPMAVNAGDYLTAWGLPKRQGTVVFQVLEPIPAGLKRSEFMRELQDRIETATAALRPDDTSVMERGS